MASKGKQPVVAGANKQAYKVQRDPNQRIIPKVAMNKPHAEPSDDIPRLGAYLENVKPSEVHDKVLEFQESVCSHPKWTQISYTATHKIESCSECGKLRKKKIAHV